MSRAPRNVVQLISFFMIFGSLARPNQKTACILGERLFNAALVNSTTKKLGEGLVVEEAMGVTIDSIDWSELNMTRDEAKDCLKEYFKDDGSDLIKETDHTLDEIPGSDEADDDEKVSTYLKPYNFREKGYFVKTPKQSLWSKATRYYDGFIDKVADFMGISD